MGASSLLGCCLRCHRLISHLQVGAAASQEDPGGLTRVTLPSLGQKTKKVSKGRMVISA